MSIRHPWYFIPSLYFAEGVPYILINVVSVIIYKNLGINNARIAFWTSLLYLPWVLKMLWSPLVEVYSTKRNWIIYSQLAMMFCLILAALSLQLSNFFLISLIIFTIGAFISATHDIAADGIYLLALTLKQQEFFAGIRTIFYRLAVIFGSGLLVFLAGNLQKKWDNVSSSWTFCLGLSGLIFGIIFIYHQLILPDPPVEITEHSLISQKVKKTPPFWEIFISYFRQPKIVAILAFILFYRFGEAMLVKLTSPFLLDKAEQGGLGLSTETVGLVYGTFGIIALIIGSILGGIVIAKYSLKKMIFPLALALHLPNLFYVYMSLGEPPLQFVYLLVALEQFGSGLGLTAFMVYLMQIAQGKYKTSHYAISTGIMALGMMLPGAVSGYIQQEVGYTVFFVIVCLFAILGIATVFFVPIEKRKS
ncbi:AmpG family muropeptide MFS transporter [Gloeocapsa sp. PCC 73106]|uniref:AmpG family muropeptide MFS transporter n=1 Tax=Gloeocapsa sp. PCC 73106 TaxID=102232 RepID=UPI0002ACD158|nr:AmpG family muropeptide MFS transporter [Gloeocapsa sp. PCC 73106]ELR99093.1 arabinose efflux permease family protein [Gloeocapsa sp. PCC 73106]